MCLDGTRFIDAPPWDRIKASWHRKAQANRFQQLLDVVQAVFLYCSILFDVVLYFSICFLYLSICFYAVFLYVSICVAIFYNFIYFSIWFLYCFIYFPIFWYIYPGSWICMFGRPSYVSLTLAQAGICRCQSREQLRKNNEKLILLRFFLYFLWFFYVFFPGFL